MKARNTKRTLQKTLFPAFILLIGFGLLSACTRIEEPEHAEAAIQIHFLDVGQGDACLIQSNNGQKFLIDVGKPGSSLMEFLDENRIDTLESIFITHSDLDHYGSLEELLDRKVIKRVFLPPEGKEDESWRRLMERLDAFIGIQDTLFLGDTVILGEGMTLSTLWPMSSSDLKGNNLSLVLRLDYAGHRILFTGDIEKEAELEILKLNARLDCDLLKVAHHGSRSSSLPTFLASASPNWAVISCDSSAFGHPHPETLAGLRRFVSDDSRILRTDRNGHITCSLYPGNIGMNWDRN